MDAAERARLWHALGLGPLWRERAREAAPAALAGVAQALQASEGETGRAAGELATAAGAALGMLDWTGLADAVAACTACGLCRKRKQTVFAAGRPQARWMFIGEAPGAEEDERGEPFVGQAGRLLDNMLAEIGLDRDPPPGSPRDAVCIANVIKCRPPGNRNPEPAEVDACRPFLLRQIEIVQPRLIVVMGRFAVQALLDTDASIASLRGRVRDLALGGRNIPTVVTYHPAYLLRTLADKAKAWDDLCLARATFDAQN